MSTAFELYAIGPKPPDNVWAVVSNLRRLPEWTDAEAVEDVPDGEPAIGTEFTTVVGSQRLRWRVVTAERRIIEVEAEMPNGRLEVGLRVVPAQAGGTRIALAGRLSITGRLARVREVLVGVPGLRRRMDRWAHAALAAA